MNEAKRENETNPSSNKRKESWKAKRARQAASKKKRDEILKEGTKKTIEERENPMGNKEDENPTKESKKRDQ